MIVREAIPRDEPCLLTCSGKHLRLLDPDPAQIDLRDIAHGLAYQGCFGGQTRYFYSLAQHSLLVADVVNGPHSLAALLHDAAAAYLGDPARPLRQLGGDWPMLERRLLAAIGERFAISGFDSPAVRRAHLIVQATEQRDVLARSPEARSPRGRPVPIPRRIDFMSPEEAKFQFCERFEQLMAQRSAAADKPAPRPTGEPIAIPRRKTAN